MSDTKSVDYQTLENIISNLVTIPENVQITRNVDEQGVLLSVIVDAQDMGIVIGRNGMMANSIKTIMRAIGKANKMNIRVEFLEPDGSRREVRRRSESQEQSVTPMESSNDDGDPSAIIASDENYS